MLQLNTCMLDLNHTKKMSMCEGQEAVNELLGGNLADAAVGATRLLKLQARTVTTDHSCARSRKWRC